MGGCIADTKQRPFSNLCWDAFCVLPSSEFVIAVSCLNTKGDTCEQALQSTLFSCFALLLWTEKPTSKKPRVLLYLNECRNKLFERQGQNQHAKPHLTPKLEIKAKMALRIVHRSAGTCMCTSEPETHQSFAGTGLILRIWHSQEKRHSP